jgi:radical SAM superfamily enzyme YgiQ (UPF0313 family)
MIVLPRTIGRPGRYVGIEPNATIKKLKTGDIRFALCYPDIYEIGMSYFGLFLLYELMNNIDGVWCERCFAPWHDMEEYLRGSNTALFTLESKTPLNQTDLVGFSLTYELNVTNVLNMLTLGGIPIRSRERKDGPIVIGGGPLMLNPRPFESFFDLIVIGEAEGALTEIVTRLKGLKGLPRTKVIEELARLDGVFSPLFPKERVERLYIEDLNSAYHPIRPPIPTVDSVHNRLNLEISRGCGNGCRFCAAGFGYRPYRERQLQTLEGIMDRSLAATGYEEISLLSLSTGDYSCLPSLIGYLREKHPKVSVSLPSLKIGSVAEEEIDLLGKGARGGFTFALEASTAELRDRLNKDIETDALMKNLPLLKKHGWRKVKLYFMVGFPWEKEEDFLAIRELIVPFVRNGIEVNLSVSPFTPKPHTPFQWLAMEDESLLAEKISLIRRSVPSKGVKIKVRDIRASTIEALIARGDERLEPLFEELHHKGVRLEAWDECFDPELYAEWLETGNGLGAELLGRRTKAQRLPWDFIDTGVDKSFLVDELEKAELREKTEGCYDACAACGVACAGPRRDRKTTIGEPIAGCQTNIAMFSDSAPALSTTNHQPPTTNAIFTLRYSKSGDTRYFGHLDTVDLLLRALRSAGISLKMHGKFHPKPRVSLSPALPTGVESTQEFVQIEVEGIEDIDRSITEKINNRLPKGMRILGVTRGKMDSTANEFTYLLVGRDGPDHEARVIGEAGERAFSLWQGKNVKELWLSGEFRRIVKVDPARFSLKGDLPLPMIRAEACKLEE